MKTRLVLVQQYVGLFASLVGIGLTLEGGWLFTLEPLSLKHKVKK